jgi:hypothetical protein
VAKSRPEGPWRYSRQAVNTAFLAAVVLLIASVVQAVHVHHAYGAWGLRPGAQTPRIPFHGRDYLRDNGMGAVPANAVVVGTAPGNGVILSPPPISDYAPTVLFVRYPDGVVTAYELSGGP